MENLNYRELSPALRAAWLVYKECYSGPGEPNLAAFVAGWNAAKGD